MVSRRTQEDEIINALSERPPSSTGSSFRKTVRKVPSFRSSFSHRKESSRRNIASSSRQLFEIIDGIESVLPKPTKVTFDLDNNEYYEPVSGSQLDKGNLWWTREELQATRAHNKLLASSDDDAAAYIRAYERAYRMVNSDRKITSESLKDLVDGLRSGFRGLEDLVSVPDFPRSNANMKKYVAAVVKHYRDCTKKECRSNGSFRKQDSVRSVGSLLRGDSVRSFDTEGSSVSGHVERSVRNFSRKLTAGSRHFAQSMGRAEKLAIACRAA